MERVKRCTCTGIHCVNCTDFRGKNSSLITVSKFIKTSISFYYINLEMKNTYLDIFVLTHIRD